MNIKPIPWLRILAIVLLSLTAAMTLMGAIGTTCVAFDAEKYGPRMALLAPVKPIFQLLVFVSLATGLFGVYGIVRLVHGRHNALRQVIIFLLVGLIASGVQYYFSLTLRGSTAPNNIRFYLTGLTLLVILLLRLPGIRQRTGLDGGAPSGAPSPGGMALFLCGLATITTPVWAAPTHLIDGRNTVSVLLWPLLAGGALQIVLGGWRWCNPDYEFLSQISRIKRITRVVRIAHHE